MNDASSNRARCHNINNIYFQAKLQPGLLIPVIKANGSSVLISASPEPTGRVWIILGFFGGFFLVFFLQPHGKRGIRLIPHTLPGSREERAMARAQSRATAGAAAFAQSCFSRGMKECSSLHKDKSLLQLITRIIRKTPARDTTRSLFWKNPSLRATASSSPSLTPGVVLPPRGSRLLQKDFWCRLHHFGPSWERSSTCHSPRATLSRAAMPLKSPTREQSTPKCPRSRVRALPTSPRCQGSGKWLSLGATAGCAQTPTPRGRG